jgi:hypothetical protein
VQGETALYDDPGVFEMSAVSLNQVSSRIAFFPRHALCLCQETCGLLYAIETSQLIEGEPVHDEAARDIVFELEQRQ